MNLAIRDQGWQLDFSRFRRYLSDKYKVQKAFLFIGYIAKNEKLYDYLRSSGYELVFKPVVEQQGKAKGNVDAELVLHAAAIEYSFYSKAVVVSDDGDFRCLIEYLQQNGKLEKLMVPNKFKYSSLLRPFENETVFLNLLQKKLSARTQKQ